MKDGNTLLVNGSRVFRRFYTNGLESFRVGLLQHARVISHTHGVPAKVSDVSVNHFVIRLGTRDRFQCAGAADRHDAEDQNHESRPMAGHRFILSMGLGRQVDY